MLQKWLTNWASQSMLALTEVTRVSKENFIDVIFSPEDEERSYLVMKAREV